MITGERDIIYNENFRTTTVKAWTNNYLLSVFQSLLTYGHYAIECHEGLAI